MSRRLWLITSLFYVGTLLANLGFYLGNECGFVLIPGAQAVFVGMIALLLLFAWWTYRRYGGRLTRTRSVGLIAGHIVLFELTLAVDCTATTTFLYLLIPFMTYLFLGKRMAITAALLYSIWFNAYFRIFRVDPLGDYIFRAVIFELSMIFSLTMASVVKEVLVGRARERQLHRRLQAAHEQLARYARDVKELGATEERNRLARDIHDSVGHYLAAVTVQLEKALAFQAADPLETERAIRAAGQAARDALRDVRRSVGALRQSAEFFSLAAALRELIRSTAIQPLIVELNLAGEENGYSKSALMALYRTTQEGLTNVQRHAAAGRVWITLHLGEERAELTVVDDGVGFDPALVAAPDGARHGLHGMRERLTAVGGQLRIDRRPQGGTKLTAIVPRQPVVAPEVPA